MDSESVSLWRSGLFSTFAFAGKKLVLKNGLKLVALIDTAFISQPFLNKQAETCGPIVPVAEYGPAFVLDE
jgi:hypothetical protein